MMKLNLGCGSFKKEGYINVDINSKLLPDILHDLNKVPYPFPDDNFDLIEADHVLEHLENPLAIMKELHRILRNNGKLKIKVPHFSRSFTHPDHRRGFDVSFPYYFKPSFKGGYIGVEFVLKKKKFVWFAQRYLKRTVLPVPLYYLCLLSGYVIDFFANIFPELFSRLMCFYVGGFDEIQFYFTCKK